MGKNDHHEKPYDEATKTKLEIFRLYTEKWLPVFLTEGGAWHPRVDIFDFFAGPGADVEGTPGSPLLILETVESALRQQKASSTSRIYLHLFDKEPAKVEALRERISAIDIHPQIEVSVRAAPFDKALPMARSVLADRSIPKLLFIDQFGISAVSDEIFLELAGYQKCDWLFFISSWTHHRFRDHPAIKERITEVVSPQHVHRAVTKYYRGLLPAEAEYRVAPFSLRKGSNVYGVTFCTGHIRGAVKFVETAWAVSPLYGTANYDVDGDGLRPDQGTLSFVDTRPTKVATFQRELEDKLRSRQLQDELGILEVCVEHGVLPQHGKEVIARLKKEGVFTARFTVPQAKRWKEPWKIEYSGDEVGSA